jgi:DNA-binding transcriptional ArsR family regulator
MAKRGEAPSEEDLEQLAGLFRLLSDRTRLNLLMLLADGERNVSTLCDSLHLPQPTVSHHLGLLRMSNVIGNRREGKQVFYSLNAPRVET